MNKPEPLHMCNFSNIKYSNFVAKLNGSKVTWCVAYESRYQIGSTIVSSIVSKAED